MTRYDLFRRRIAPVAFGVAIALLARDSCNKSQRTHATVTLDFGDAAKRVRAVDGELFVDGDADAQSTFHRVALDDRTIGCDELRRHPAAPSPDAELRLDIDLGAVHRHVVRHLHADDGATVTISLADELRLRAAP